MLCFFHYIALHVNFKYDKRPMMGIGTKVSKEIVKNTLSYQ